MRALALLALLSFPVACQSNEAKSSAPPDVPAPTVERQPAKVAPPATETPPPPPAKAVPPAERARELAQRFIIVDGHVDLPFRLYRWDQFELARPDLTAVTKEGDFDYARARLGGLNAPFMSIYVPSEYQTPEYQGRGGAKRFADGLIGLVEGLAKKHPELSSLARSPADVRKSFAQGQLALAMGMENGAPLEGDLANVAYFRSRGISYITLTHSKDNAICDSSYDTRHTHGGLSQFGRDVIREMNRVGIMVDVSHVSDAAFEQATELSRVPVIASHSSLRHFVPGFERNVSDVLLKKLAAKGGVVMINFGSGFLLPKSNERNKARYELRAKYARDQGLNLDHPTQRARADAYVNQKLPMLYASADDVADHIDRARDLVGIDHIGLGSDFDGVGDSLPLGLKDASGYPELIRILLTRGYSETDIEKVCSGNVLRVWQRVLDFAKAASK